MKIKLAYKLLAAFLAVGVIPVVIVGLVAMDTAEGGLRSAAFDQLQAVQTAKQKQIETLVGDIQGDLENLGAILVALRTAINARDTARFEQALVSQHDRFLRDYVETLGFDDLYLIRPDGYIFYSARKRSDFQTNLLSGPYRDSDFARTVRRAIESRRAMNSDFMLYRAAGDEPVTFFILPVIEDGEVTLLLAFQIGLSMLNAITQQRDGMGQSGETYLVGADNLRRSDSVIEPHRNVAAALLEPARHRIESEPLRLAQTGRSGTVLTDNLDGDAVVSSYGPIAFGTVPWSILSEIDQSEAFAELVEMRNEILLKLVLAVIVVVVVALLLTRSITLPVSRAAAMLEQMGRGRIEGRLGMKRGDEIGDMARSMDRFADTLEQQVVSSMVSLSRGDLTYAVEPYDERDLLGNALLKTRRDLNRIVGEIRTVTEQIAVGADQVSSTSLMLAQGATESAASLEQITSSLSEIAAQTKLNAENSNQASRLTQNARQTAEVGNGQMAQVVAAMTEIRQAGQNISKIIKVIDEIAFQTNLLALNAGVEAVRAGKYGKGFAVVAEEVRSMAAHSAKAARETAELIEGAVQKTEMGAELAKETAESLKEIMESISQATDLVSEIAVASGEQAQGLAQVNEGLGQIDQVTQTNAAAAEEGAAAAEELSTQTNRLRRLMGTFTVSEETEEDEDGDDDGWWPGQGRLGSGPEQRRGRREGRGSEYARDGQGREKEGRTHFKVRFSEHDGTNKIPRPHDVISLTNGEFGRY